MHLKTYMYLNYINLTSEVLHKTLIFFVCILRQTTGASSSSIPTLYTHFSRRCGNVKVTCTPTWFSVMDVGVDEADDNERDQRRHPVDEEHDDDTQQRTQQRQPPRVVLKGRSPACKQTHADVSSTSHRE